MRSRLIGPEFDEIKLDQSEFKELRSHQPEVNEIELGKSKRRYQRRSPAVVAELINHIWTIKELLMT
jgi:hypothetical protein